MIRFITVLLLFFAQQAVFAQTLSKHIIDLSESGETLFFRNITSNKVEVKINHNTGDEKFLLLIAQDADKNKIIFKVINPSLLISPIFSYDERHWNPIKKSWFEGDEFYFECNFQNDIAYIWLVPPVEYIAPGSVIEKFKPLEPPYYDLSRLEAYVNSVVAHPLVEQVILGQSVQGRNIQQLTITNTSIPDSCKKSVWLQFRVHGNEMEQSYIFEGLVDYLLADDSLSLAPEMLDKIIFKLIPAINPDGIEMETRRNANNIDLNRIWVDSTNHEAEEPEVRCVHDALDDWVLNQGQKIYFAIDHHGWGKSRDGGYVTKTEVAGDAYVNEQNTFLSYLIHFDPWQQWDDWKFSDGQWGMARLALRRQHNLNILTAETTGVDRYDGSATNIENLQQQGPAFITAIYRYLYHIYFVDNKNNEVNSYPLSDSIFIRLEDEDANSSGLVFDSCTVTLISSSGDTENVVLNEKVAAKGIFYCDAGIPLTTAASTVNDGFLQVQDGDQVAVYYQDIDFPDDHCKGEAVIKSGSDVSRFADHIQPDDYNLFQNYPNPFNCKTSIRFNVTINAAELGKISLKIINLLGEEVKTLINKRLVPGMHTLEWDGTDNFGNIVSSGVYLYSFEGGNIRLINKLLLLK